MNILYVIFLGIVLLYDNFSVLSKQKLTEEGKIVFKLDELNGVCTSELSSYDSILIYFQNNKTLLECNRAIPHYNETGEIQQEFKQTSFILKEANQAHRWQVPKLSYQKEAALSYKMNNISPIAKLVFTKETKKIAGYLCKKVIIEHKVSDIKGQNSAIKFLKQLDEKSNLQLLPIPYKTTLYYTDKLPKHLSLFQYANLNGCILEHIGVDGLHILATSIKFQQLSDSLFIVPKE